MSNLKPIDENMMKFTEIFDMIEENFEKFTKFRGTLYICIIWI